MRMFVNKFYRIDHVYEVIREFKNDYKGEFSILEFGVADGYSFVKLLYAVRYLDMEDRIKVHGFDTFQGLPEKVSYADSSFMEEDEWREGYYKGRYDNLLKYCKNEYSKFELHKGFFKDTIDDNLLAKFKSNPPILIWIDCDYYSSAKSVFDNILRCIPTGCVIYFDDIELNYESRFTGEMKLVWQINNGKFGDGVELVLDRDLSWGSNRVYRFININSENKYEKKKNNIDEDPVRLRRDDSPFP